jgi:hypothetical protein
MYLARKICGPKRDEVTGDWRKLHNEDLHNLYSLPDIRLIKFKGMRWAGHRAFSMHGRYKKYIQKFGWKT